MCIIVDCEGADTGERSGASLKGTLEAGQVAVAGMLACGGCGLFWMAAWRLPLSLQHALCTLCAQSSLVIAPGNVCAFYIHTVDIHTFMAWTSTYMINWQQLRCVGHYTTIWGTSPMSCLSKNDTSLESWTPYLYSGTDRTAKVTCFKHLQIWV